MRKRISRTDERGAIFVESIIVVVFFTLCFLGVVYFRELYVGKMRVQRLARSSAMAHAMNACSGDIKAGLERDLPKNAAPPSSAKTPGDPAPPGNQKGEAHDALEAFDQTKTGTPLDEITAITVTTSANATTKNPQTLKEQGFRGTVSASSFVTCGDPVSDEGIEQIFPRIGAVFESFFF
ncbi:MAG: hypothetical protein JWP87_4966 [Labilithrix sp.]|nr:hypothetical protein [Labilithrix sp.]